MLFKHITHLIMYLFKAETFVYQESPILSDAVSLLSVLGPKFLDTNSTVKSNSDEKVILDQILHINVSEI